MSSPLNNGHFGRHEFITSALILKEGPVTGYRLMEVADSLSGSIYPFLHRAVEHGLLLAVDFPANHPKRGPDATHYDLSLKGLLLANIELGLVQVPDLSQLVRQKAQQYEQ